MTASSVITPHPRQDLLPCPPRARFRLFQKGLRESGSDGETRGEFMRAIRLSVSLARPREGRAGSAGGLLQEAQSPGEKDAGFLGKVSASSESEPPCRSSFWRTQPGTVVSLPHPPELSPVASGLGGHLPRAGAGVQVGSGSGRSPGLRELGHPSHHTARHFPTRNRRPVEPKHLVG